MRRRRILRAARANLAFLLAVSAFLAGFIYVTVDGVHWLRGVIVMGLAVCGGGVMRLALPERRAGILVVRGRAFDVFCYLVLGVLVVTFAVLAPS
jgi:Protein of unknown function (DUF3017)